MLPEERATDQAYPSRWGLWGSGVPLGLGSGGGNFRLLRCVPSDEEPQPDECPPMKDVPENELLSAYLDGELTAAEQADVEQLLARSPAARQLLQELRALSAKLQALPQCRLGEDLSQQVLRVAQRRMLATSAASGELPQPAPAPRRAILRRLVSSRALVWSSLAVAVAVILTVMDRGPKKQIAITPPAREEAAKEKAGRTPEIGPAPKEGVLPRELGDAKPGETSGQTEESSKAGSRSAADQDRAKDGAIDLAKTHDSASLTPGAAQGKRHVAEKVSAIRGGPIAKGVAGSPPVQWDLLVQCQLSPQAQGKEVFDKALADNGIVWDEAPASGGVLAGNAAVVQEQRQEQIGQQKPDDANRPAADHSDRASGPTEGWCPARAVPAVPAGKVDVVYVEAPWVQVNALLTALEARPEAISLISSGPTAEVETLRGPSRNLTGQVQLRKGGGTGAVRGFRVGGGAAEAPAAPLEQRLAGGYKGQDNLGRRAYARRLQLPTTGLDLAAKFGRGAEPTGEPPQSATAGPTVPPGRTPKPAQSWAGQPWQQEAHRTDAGVPMVRALFVLHVADLESGAASVEAKPDTGKAASEGRKASPPPAVEQ